MIFKHNKIKSFILLILLLMAMNLKTSAKINASVSSHELTIYVMPTLFPLDWESPAALYHSVRRGYMRNIFRSNHYLLGHVAVELNSTHLDEPLLIAQTSGTFSEKWDLIMKQKAGYAIIGAPLEGRLEQPGELRRKLRVYSRRGKLAFIRYRLNDIAANRIMQFIRTYSEKMNDKYAPSDFYGGAFWPRYYNEGSGCSAFAMVMLEMNHLLTDETDLWRLDHKIPMELIGGRFNNGHEVKLSAIKGADAWFEGEGAVNEDYVMYSVYDPNLIFDWIMAQRNMEFSDFRPVDDAGIPGLFFDAQSVEVNPDEAIFIQRRNPDLFIDSYFKKINIKPDWLLEE